MTHGKTLLLTPDIAFKVDHLELAVAGMRLLLGPFEPIENYRVATIEDHGQPIEFIQTTLTDDEIWSRAATRELRPDNSLVS